MYGPPRHVAGIAVVFFSPLLLPIYWAFYKLFFVFVLMLGSGFSIPNIPADVAFQIG
jgi:hypothetical protein